MARSHKSLSPLAVRVEASSPDVPVVSEKKNIGLSTSIKVHTPTPFRQKKINGEVYNLDHLCSFSFEIETESGNKVVHVDFSCHCFTEDFTTSHSPSVRYNYKGETRAFCVNRHLLSKSLQSIITTLGTRSVHNTNIGTFFTLRNGMDGANGAPYVVFFSTAKSTKEGVDVLMLIKSAYPKPNMTQRASPVKFTTLVEATAAGKRVPLGPAQTIKRK